MAAIAVGTVVVGAMVAAHLIRTGMNEYRKSRAGVDVRGERQRREWEIRDVNDEIDEYEDKRFRDGRLNEYDQHQLNRLHCRREDKAELLAQTNEIVIANQVAEGVGTYDNVNVTDVNTHILQFHVGQTVFGKTCPRCDRPMVLQWQRHLETVRMSDFFWGCTGYFGDFAGTRSGSPIGT